MKNFIFTLTILFFNQLTQADLTPYFEGFTGCLVIESLDGKEQIIYNPEQAEKRLIPCSTFKIPHSLIALDVGVATGADHFIAWDGEEKFFTIDGEKFVVDSWNQDQTLRHAFQNSVLWYYIELSQEIGRSRMEHYLDILDYGTETIGDDYHAFWLDGDDLKISAHEQIDFLRRMINHELPITKRSIEIMKGIMIVERDESSILYGKTGSGYQPGHAWGWYVGYLEAGEQTYIFAINLENDYSAGGRKAREILKEVLAKIGLRQNEN